ncbi:MAG: SAM-dependent methyltransferase [Bacteroidales bacterium]|nr:SAM-dependent methyltransferase [Bacteroidales bacterium]
MSGILYLIPSPLGENEPKEVIPAPVFELLPKLQHFVVEELRTVRRYLSKAGLKGKIAELNLYELNEHTLQKDVEKYVQILKEGNDVGLISEAGLPAVADPGALLVELAHKNDIEVMPFVGPSSLMLALMASGLNGQCFAFTGYLPVKPDERRAKIRSIEKISAQLRQSQIIIETPYRNDQFFADLLSTCSASTRICVAADITLPTQFIKTRSVAEWKKRPVVIGKRPCVFILLG